ncbi:MAG: BrnA antitoxin family protein [Alphaproteobacteria bacterium]|nr:BrnA antitoxin family protein [Alphaproteobacteria bacterium]
MKKKIVSYTLETIPPLTKKQRANLRELAARPDSDIDYSDSPSLPDEAWKNAVRGRFYRPTKRQVTARIDEDVIEWLKSFGKGYQSRINAILRREMLASTK